MAGDVHAIFVHGIGEQKSGYSAFAQKRLRIALRERGISLCSEEVLWAPILGKLENEMLRDVEKRGSKLNAVQRLSISTLADATSYRDSLPEIFDLLDRAYMRLRSDRVHIFCHSLGVVISLAWLNSRDKVTATMSSFGVNAQMFALGSRFQAPPTLRAEGRWRSFFYPTDGLGFPIAGWMPQVTDYKLTVPFWSVGTIVPSLSHLAYWGDRRLWSQTIPAGF
jgi:hypothetical protein